MTDRCDVIVIGAGHNGLSCATFLARAGLSVVVLEARERAGGMAQTHEFAPGFRVSSCAHYLYQMPMKLVDELRLGSHGLTMDPRPLSTVSLAADRAPRVLGAVTSHGLEPGDARAYEAFRAQMLRFAGFLQTIKDQVPPRLTARDRHDSLGLARTGLALRRLGRDDMREFLRLIASNIYDLLNEKFSDNSVKGALALDAVLGTHMGPRSPGTVFTLLHRLGGGGIRQPIGGFGAFSDALCASAREAGVQIRLGNAVSRILLENRRASGVQLADGSTLNADQVVSGADPKTTVNRLLGACHVETGFARRIHNLRARGTAAKLHLALKALPPAPPGADDLLRQRLVFAPDMDYVERAFNPVKYGAASPEPVLEISVPTVADPGLAPAGQHVVSIIAQYAPYRPAHGWSAHERAAFQRSVIAAADRALPGLAREIVHSELLTPDDIERDYGCHGGHWHHGELALDQYYFTRPVVHAAQYALPVDGLFLCSAGAHPGGHVAGLAGRNAAGAVLAARKGRHTP